ncbi:hypothetical protein BC351_21775 [Paenibacillus ferrarius]|uniref:Uncharacterized protein n=1 Tax=Paenibacillus ferrarius TaxID=1469647 RepID=A0A1V4HMQ5_9BACL|nr:hypothetical protein [Paenibacillus ferrarius]OPH58969.1 hypothetical protein BC351_21775 [Paenibacillus ferrarius]
MVIWKGWGILAVLMAMAGFVIGMMIESAIYGSSKGILHGWPYTLTLIAAAVGIWFSGKALNKSAGRVLVDPQTNQQFKMGTPHTLFFIPMQYTSFVLGLIAILMLFSK